MSDELTLSASWVQASDSFSKMAQWMGDTSQAAPARQASDKARKSFARHYWDRQADFWIDGYSPAGKKIVNRSASGDVAISQHLFNKTQERQLLDQLASPNFQTDWGTRSTALNSSAFNPDSYAKGSVWAVGTANAAMAFWADHRPSTALPIWSGLIPWASLDSLGHMDEVLAGDYYHEQTESVPEQTWSSAMFFRSAVQGLLGLRVDALADKIVLSPHMPADWKTVTLRNIQLPESKIDVTWTRTPQGSELETANTGAPVHLDYSPEIPLGAHLTGATWNGKRVPARLDEHPQESNATLDLELPHGKAYLQLGYKGGISLLIPHLDPVLGDSSRAMKLLGAKLRGATYILDAEVDTGHASTFQLWTERKVIAAHGATWKTVSPNEYVFTIASSRPPDRHSSYSPVEILIDLDGAR